jgi:hypothetical protein
VGCNMGYHIGYHEAITWAITRLSCGYHLLLADACSHRRIASAKHLRVMLSPCYHKAMTRLSRGYHVDYHVGCQKAIMWLTQGYHVGYHEAITWAITWAIARLSHGLSNGLSQGYHVGYHVGCHKAITCSWPSTASSTSLAEGKSSRQCNDDRSCCIMVESSI